MTTNLDLTLGQRRTQTRLAALLTAKVGVRLRGLDGATIASSEWIEALLPIIQAERRKSARAGATYYSALRLLELGGSSDDYAVPELDGLADAVVRSSLAVTGQRTFERLVKRGMDESAALRLVRGQVAGSAMRHALNGGRQQVLSAVRRDPAAIGWARVTREAPCWFCAMLASRGAVYKDDSFDSSDPRFIGSDSDVKVHDSCQCVYEPRFRRDALVSEASRKAADLWEQVTGPYSGHEKALAFRRAWEALQRA